MSVLLKSKMALTFVVAGGLSLGSLPVAVAQEDAENRADDYTALSSDEPVELTALKCWDVTTLNEDDRAFVMVLLYGYAKGVAGQSKLTPRTLQVAVVNTMLECVDKPDGLVLDVLKTHIRD
ncbi:hypothetical protein [uncultured Erythrobacter sp.]|uniref:hypothetical protein n=1 Tax=uncultured Erythrobacter sp. TaxID=263913 RepID=UPI00261A8C21|nr:hypothetical protein [uncultured Erythrobacter sp.]